MRGVNEQNDRIIGKSDNETSASWQSLGLLFRFRPYYTSTLPGMAYIFRKVVK